VKIDTDRANAAGVTNTDIAYATLEATDGVNVGMLRQDNKQIPIVARLQTNQQPNLSDVQNVYVSSSQGPEKLPLSSLSTIETQLANRRIRRQEHFRTIGFHVFPQHGELPSELISKAMPALKELEKGLPPGYRMVIGGEIASQKESFLNLALVLLISATGIYAALLMQFKNAIKPLLVFAAVPYGVVGALLALVATGTAFGFIAFLGIISLIGVIVSHIIVLFDFIEEMHDKGEPLEQALRDAGVERLRPVLITVGRQSSLFSPWHITEALFGSPCATHKSVVWRQRQSLHCFSFQCCTALPSLI
jgi:multidrug efflux pump subunit AcrB